ncbi:hypothetical protein [Isachenkonia alkalipeptolytica]|nr:hypothetical protein [Isachenkonia alkalipeptolytica]
MSLKKLLAAGILSLALVGFVGCGEAEDIDPEEMPEEEVPAEDEGVDD